MNKVDYLQGRSSFFSALMCTYSLVNSLQSNGVPEKLNLL